MKKKLIFLISQYFFNYFIYQISSLVTILYSVDFNNSSGNGLFGSMKSNFVD